MDVSTEESVVSAMAGSGGRSIRNRLTNSAAQCWASAALPPLPASKILPPRATATAMRPGGLGHLAPVDGKKIAAQFRAVFRMLGNHLQGFVHKDAPPNRMAAYTDNP